MPLIDPLGLPPRERLADRGRRMSMGGSIEEMLGRCVDWCAGNVVMPRRLPRRGASAPGDGGLVLSVDALADADPPMSIAPGKPRGEDVIVPL